MLQTSVEFACYFCVVLAIGWALRPYREVFKASLLAASYIFYASFHPAFVLLLAGVSLLTYGAGRALAGLQEEKSRRRLVAGYLALVLGNLCFFKYYGMVFELLGLGLDRLGMSSPLPDLSLVLPVGISFFTFQGIGYVVDAYRDRTQVCRSLLDVLLFMAFFPTLLSGPILRAKDFIPQLSAPEPAWEDSQQAFWLIIVGLFKKITLSSYLSEHITRQLFSSPEGYSSLGALVGVFAYSAQIYCDFSGYSDMAQGLAGLLGLKVPDNFHKPYKALNLREFWQGWHISLSTWLRDYLYIPLGGNRCSKRRQAFNLLATMGLGGLWHGASLTFLAWGLLHGAGLAVTHALAGRFTVPVQGRAGRVWKVLCWAGTFGFVSLAWVFFAAPDFGTAWAVLGRVVSFDAVGTGPGLVLPLMVACVVGLQALRLDVFVRCPDRLRHLPAPLLGAALGGLGALIVRLGPDGVLPFIYFSF